MSSPPVATAGGGFAAALRLNLRSLCLWATVCTLWISARPWRGVRHDAVLYLAQVFNKLSPETYGSDLFFRYGSQDRYSAFSALVAPLVQTFGVSATEVVLLLVAQLLLLVGVARLMDQVGLARWRWAALLMLACSPHFYVNSDMGNIAFAEPFMTARTLAEPFAVWALVGLLQRRWTLAALAALGGVALHPLIVLPLLMVGWAWLCLGDRRWLWLALFVPVVGLLALAGVPPFDAAARRYDAVWWDIVVNRNPLAFATRWVAGDELAAAFDFGVLGVAWRMAVDKAQARFWLANLLAMLGLMVVSLLGAEVAHDVLLTQMQLWRVMWWVQLLVLAASPWLMFTLWRGDRMLKVAALAMAVSLLAIGANWTTGWVFMAAFALALVGHWRKIAISTTLLRLVAVAFGLGAVVITVVVFTSDIHVLAQGTDGIPDISWLRVLLSVQATVLLAGAALIWLQKRLPLAAAGSVSVVLLVAAFAGWDQRSDWTVYLETTHATPNPFNAVMAPGSDVFWMDDLKAPWMGLRRPSYFSIEQAAGLLFNRDTAVEYERRAIAFGPLNAQRELCSFIAGLNGPDTPPDPKCYPTPETAQLICKLQGGPRYLVFRSALDRGVVSHWRFDAPRQPAQSTDYYLHDCNKMIEADR
ncbi:MAG: hypothetical protein ABJD97_01495 [Betaproteobacteria bacterium]